MTPDKLPSNAKHTQAPPIARILTRMALWPFPNLSGRRTWKLCDSRICAPGGVKGGASCTGCQDVDAPLLALLLTGGILLTTATRWTDWAAWSMVLSHSGLYATGNGQPLKAREQVARGLDPHVRARYAEEVGVCVAGLVAADFYGSPWLADVRPLVRPPQADEWSIELRDPKGHRPDYLGESSCGALVLEAKGTMDPGKVWKRADSGRKQLQNVARVYYGLSPEQCQTLAVATFLSSNPQCDSLTVVEACPPCGPRPQPRPIVRDHLLRQYYAKALQAFHKFDLAAEMRESGRVNRDVGEVSSGDYSKGSPAGMECLSLGFTESVWRALSSDGEVPLSQRLREAELPEKTTSTGDGPQFQVVLPSGVFAAIQQPEDPGPRSERSPSLPSGETPR